MFVCGRLLGRRLWKLLEFSLIIQIKLFGFDCGVLIKEINHLFTIIQVGFPGNLTLRQQFVNDRNLLASDHSHEEVRKKIQQRGQGETEEDKGSQLYGCGRRLDQSTQCNIHMTYYKIVHLKHMLITNKFNLKICVNIQSQKIKPSCSKDLSQSELGWPFMKAKRQGLCFSMWTSD